MQLNDIVPWGRNFNEYRRMFQLSNADLSKYILGCGDGPASFNAEMTEQGHSVISIDPIYEFSAAQIQQRVKDVYEPIISQVKTNAEQYVWTTIRTPDELGTMRLTAMEHFLADYDAGKQAGRYLAQSLPKLSFSSQEPPFFELCLCSHLLFLYSDHLSLNFHQQSIIELLRVAAEVRIFPILTLNGDISPYLGPIHDDLTDLGFQVWIEKVDYEFQKGGNQMLKIYRE